MSDATHLSFMSAYFILSLIQAKKGNGWWSIKHDVG
jgi:hypothetical protein